MTTSLVTMSQQELTRLEVIQRIVDNRLTQTHGAQILKLSLRQVQRLVRAYRTDGAAGLVSRRRGHASNHQLSVAVRERAIDLLRSRYPDFGPTLAAEKLDECHGIHLAVETVRTLMIQADLWIPRRQRLKRAYQPRYRRDCLGELIQIDGSEHAWFEDRAPKCTLLVFIDDATSQLMQLRFVPSESTLSYFQTTKAYLRAHGRPVAFYSDKATVFRVNQPNAVGGNGITQFGRVLSELNIDLLCANSCQAKGRVERAHKTLQDRLVKELRLKHISSVARANAFLPQFIHAYNRRFAKPPRSDFNAHRPLADDQDLEEIFCWKELRTLSKNLTLQYDKVLYMLENTPELRRLAGQRVTVCDYPDGRIKLLYQDHVLPYRIFFNKLKKVSQGDVVSNKRLGRVLEFVRNEQQAREPHIPRHRSSRTRWGRLSLRELERLGVTGS